MQAKDSYFKAIRRFNAEKGIGESAVKAVNVAMAEEMPFSKDRRLIAFIVYALCKCYFRRYRNFVRNIYFKRGKAKFVFWSLKQNFSDVSAEAFNEVEKALFNGKSE